VIISEYDVEIYVYDRIFSVLPDTTQNYYRNVVQLIIMNEARGVRVPLNV
jgi:hypothetical protein